MKALRLRSSCPTGLLVLLMLCALPTAGRPAEEEMAPSLAIELGYHAPLGDWKSHRYAPGVDQLQGGVAVYGELEAPIGGVNLVAFLGYTRFRLDDWVDYARSQGDDIIASASLATYGALARFYLGRNSPNFFHLDVGLAQHSFSGQESFAGYAYDYNFLLSDVGVVAGFGYKRLLNPQLALSLSVKGMLVFEGVQYIDGLKYDVFGVPVTLGLKYVF